MLYIVISIHIFYKVSTHDGTSPWNWSLELVPATGPCDWSLQLVASCELVIFASKPSQGDRMLVAVTSITNSNQFKFLRQLPATCSSNRLV